MRSESLTRPWYCLQINEYFNDFLEDVMRVSDGIGGRQPSCVLVTGGSGYLATWIIADLLVRGYRVRTTVRDLARADRVRQAVAERVDPVKLSFVRADLLSDEGWDAAMEGVDFVQHVASPLGTDRSQDLVRTARVGVRHVLGAADKAGVRRVVLTSSAVAALPDDDGVVADETVWASPTDKPADLYARSKTLAERDAWTFVGTSGVALELTTVLPAFIQGPVLGQISEGSSVDVVRQLLAGKMSAVPNIGWNIVDVRDLADLHVRAMIAPEAAGERFLGAGEFLWLRDIAELLRNGLGDDAAKVPTRRVPDLVVRLGARANPVMAQIAPLLGRKDHLDATKAEKLLGWRSRPADHSILDAARSLIVGGSV
ncbi:NAD-dependent epimerase/dehydratase family protein [Streptomyces sp. NPDC101151]|uniref:NAD-dependent epimerase/dehydratase family protein n=1 Tax=Streptomyces sp. NPDC101151 TaxID=3366115 RepID=UPI003828411C